MRNPEDYIGKKYGHITIIGGGEYRHRMLYMLGKCDCGKIRYFQIPRLLKQTTSCGCMNRYKHGHKKRNSHNRIYNIWQGIKQRCYDKNRRQFEYWGGRGIRMCDEWKNNFISFYNWSLNNGYKDDLTIDRIDINSNYCPENCRWATWEEQANNTRNTKYIYYNNKKYTISSLANEFNINRNKLYKRIFKYG